MSEDKIKRRRFLADILFAGGVLSAAAVVARLSQGSQPVTTTGTPSPIPTVEAHLGGEAQLGGAVAPPQIREPHIEGDVAAPTPGKDCPPEVMLGGKPAMPRGSGPTPVEMPKHERPLPGMPLPPQP